MAVADVGSEVFETARTKGDPSDSEGPSLDATRLGLPCRTAEKRPGVVAGGCLA